MPKGIPGSNRIVISGVYKIINLVNNKFYIGSSVDLDKRKFEHFNSLKNKKHCNDYLQKSFNKYGENNFEFKIISKCPSEYIIKMEQWFIDNINPDYNLCKIAGTVLGIKRSKETKDKMRIAMTGKIHTNEQNIKSWKVSRFYKENIYQLDKSMNLIKIWNMPINHIAKKLNLNRRGISECLNKRAKSAHGYIWLSETEVPNR